jgi:serine protease AprX
VSGAAALLIGARPTLTPDQVKNLLRSTANVRFMAQVNPKMSGQGLIQVDKAFAKATPTAVQTWPASDGSGLLEASRGGNHVIINGQPLTGEVTVLGNAWEGIRWAGIRWAGGTWDGIRWAGATWTGIRWADASWTGIRWAGDAWTGIRWAGIRWAEVSWT